MVRYIMRMYALVWFDIKRNYSVTYGLSHIFKVIQTTQQLTENLRQIIDFVIQKNAFFCHPENMS